MSFYDKVKAFLTDEPIYASRPGMTDAGLAEGWKVAFEIEREKLTLAEKRLKAIDELADAIIMTHHWPQYGHDIKTILHLTEEELDDNYGD